ncbi:hypothetical protein Tco_0943303 [Tanacetum coccineum]
MAPMALSDSEVKTCSKTCLKNHETLKEQYDDLRIEFNKSLSNLANCKRGLASVEEKLVFYRKNEVIFGFFSPPKIDLSNSGLEEFQEPEFEGYGPKTSKSASEDISNEVRKSNDAPLVEKLVSDDKSEKKIVFPTVAKIEFVKSKQQEKPVRKPVKYAEMYRSQKPRGNQRNWNNQKSQQLGNDFVMHNKACYVCGSFDHLQYTCKQKRQLNGQREEKPVWNNARRVNHQNSPRITHPNPKRHMVPRKILTRSGPISLNTARQSYLNAVCCCCSRQVNTARQKAVVNAVRTNRVNAVKASACWVWRPVKPNSASITLKRYDYGNPETKLEDLVRLNSPKDEKRAGAELTQQNDKSQYKKRNYQEESFTHKEEMAPMALSDSELNQSEFNLANYKRGLAYVEERLVFYKKNEGMLCEQIAVLKRDASFNESEINALKIQIERLKKEKESNQFKIDNFENASKSLDKLIGSQISDNNRKGVGYNAVAPPPTGLFAPPTIDLSSSGLEEFQQPEFEG